MKNDSAKRPVRVLVVDDSALMRQLISGLLAQDPGIEVLGTAENAMKARDMIRALNPDVLTLDIEMPGMDGLSFLRKIIELRPMPVVMISTLTSNGAEATLQALEIGAVDFIEKPSVRREDALAKLETELAAKVKAAAATQNGLRRAQYKAKARRISLPRAASIVAIGASTGGVETLRRLLSDMEADCPPIVVTQHMPPKFTTAFANRLDRICPMRVREAEGGEKIEPGTVFIAPGSHHLRIERRGSGFVTALSDDAPVSGHRPSVDVLFNSIAQSAGPEALGVILTGMGKDGSAGLLAMRHRGAMTIGQDEATSLIYGMPREAFERGAVDRQLALEEIGPAIMSAWKTPQPIIQQVETGESYERV